MSLPIVDPRLAVAGYSDNETQRKLQIDELKKHIQGGQSKEKQLHEACEGFEAIFLQKIWEQMRQGIPKSGLLESRDQEMYQSLFDVELSKKMASAGGIGLADMLYEQLNVKLGKASRATSPGILKGRQEMKEFAENGQGIELEARYGSLKADSESKLAQEGKDESGSLYDSLEEEGLEQANSNLPGQNASTAEVNAGNAGEKVSEQAGVNWKEQLSTAFNAYVGSLQPNISEVGSIAALKKETPNAPAASNGTAQKVSPGVKIVNPLAAGALTEVPVFNQASPAGDMQSAAASAIQIPGFFGMKPPFSQSPSSSEPQLPYGAGQGTFFDSAVSLGRAESVKDTKNSSNAAADSTIAPGDVVAPSAGVSGQAVSSGTGHANGVPDGIFRRFDTVPEI